MSKVIFHVDESSRWQMVLANATNMIQYGRTQDMPFEVEILANSQAVRQLTIQGAEEAEMRERAEVLSRSGARFAACRVAMGNLKIKESDLLPFVQTVPSGVVELAQRQDEGYAYIRP
ncbi:MAG: DrsE domain-containing protein [Oscillospiraceae bacterium]